MAKIEQANAFLELKQRSNRDVRQLGPLVTQFYEAESTASQTIINLSFAVEQSASSKQQVLVYVDGKLLREGSGNDYTYSSISGGQSSQITMAAPLAAGLNILVYRVGASIQSVPNASSIQATVNSLRLEVNEKDNRNGIINGCFEYWQRGTSFPAAANSSFAADRWKLVRSFGGVISVDRSTDVPTNAFGIYSAAVTFTTEDATRNSSEIVRYEQLLEGNTLRRFKNKDIVLKFWVKSSEAGVLTLALTNSDASRSLVKEYTVNAVNTWEQKTIRFAHDSTGTWFYDNQIGMRVSWVLHCGTQFQTAPDVWTSGTYYATGAQTRLSLVANNVFKLADVMLVEDNTDLTSDPEFALAGRDLYEELQLCQRYYEKSYDVNVNPGTADFGGAYAPAPERGSSNGNSTFGVTYKIKKRALGTCTFYNPSTGAINSCRYSGANYGVVAIFQGENGASAANNTGGAWPATGVATVSVHFTSESEL